MVGYNLILIVIIQGVLEHGVYCKLPENVVHGMTQRCLLLMNGTETDTDLIRQLKGKKICVCKRLVVKPLCLIADKYSRVKKKTVSFLHRPIKSIFSLFLHMFIHFIVRTLSYFLLHC